VCHALLRDTRFFELLSAIDRDLAEQTRSQGCPCGGRLHQANYARKPRGGPVGLAPGGDLRRSFCCDRDGCRRRTMPPSLRFLSRRVYFAAVVVLLTTLTHGITPRRASALREQVGVDRRTLARWRTWWRHGFSASAFWREHRGRLLAPIAAADLPAALVERFAPRGRPDELVDLLRFLAPL